MLFMNWAQSCSSKLVVNARVGIARLGSIKETELYQAAGRLPVQLHRYIKK
jgi:hypothetical protein